MKKVMSPERRKTLVGCRLPEKGGKALNLERGCPRDGPLLQASWKGKNDTKLAYKVVKKGTTSTGGRGTRTAVNNSKLVGEVAGERNCGYNPAEDWARGRLFQIPG